MRILAISGSLRVVSSNTALLRAAARLAPRGIEISLYEGLGDLPHFNPDLEGMEGKSVIDFRNQLKASDGVLISSPEYAHGVPGVLKNALDWLVGSGELVGKPIALLNASPRSTYAQASLIETIRVMSANIVAEASIAVPLPGRKLTEDGMVKDAEISSLVARAIEAFALAIEGYQMKTPEGQ
jgi:NAD(P)H-dependent FMN reductase